MNYCDKCQRRYIGPSCPFCMDNSQPVANSEQVVANKPKEVANKGRYKDLEKRKAYMKEHMRKKRAK